MTDDDGLRVFIEAARARFGAPEESIEQEIEMAVAAGVRTVCRKEFPTRLCEVSPAVHWLFVQGSQLDDRPYVAVVGARRADGYGTSLAASFGRSLAEAGVGVVSGLAAGADAAAHIGCLDAGGRTVAVLGTGVLATYPHHHRTLQRRIAENGTLLSEYAPLSGSKSFHFPLRNRIIAALVDLVVVVQAGSRSGTLSTAGWAAGLGVEVGAVPGPVTSLLSRGCHDLIRDGARVIESVDDVLEAIGVERETTSIALDGLDGDEEKTYTAMIGGAEVAEAIAGRSGVPVERVMRALALLEAKGFVARDGGRYFRTAAW